MEWKYEKDFGGGDRERERERDGEEFNEARYNISSEVSPFFYLFLPPSIYSSSRGADLISSRLRNTSLQLQNS
jgi:hypothetical protein